MNVAVFLVIALTIGSVYTYKISKYEVHQVTEALIWGPKTRIFGGFEAGEKQFPFMIFMLIWDNPRMGRCSASLVTPNWVLSAGHCIDVYNLLPKNVILVGGKANVEDYVKARMRLPLDLPVDEKELGVQERRASELHIHPRYNGEECIYDVALIKLKNQFDSPIIKPIVISKEKMKKPMECTILGWGLTEYSDSNLALNVAHNTTAKTTALGCRAIHEGPLICLGRDNKGICSGDSGGPLVCDDKVWGVASFYLYDISDKCGHSYEDYYSEIYSSLDWINERSGGNPSAPVTTKIVLVLTVFCLFLTNS